MKMSIISFQSRKTLCFKLLTMVMLSCGLLIAAQCFASSFEESPINYHKAPVSNPISKLQKKIDSGEVKLEYDETHGYLKSVLKELNVPQSSQVLVFSKTSFQLPRIDPKHPRSVYFSDDMYVGWVQNGDVVEISTVDPQLGAIFYSLEQKETAKPKFTRHGDRCLICHASSKTEGVPGHIVRSVFSDKRGMPVFRAGTFRIDHTSPMKNRWGGWYVSGTHGKQRHMGNVLVEDKNRPEDLDIEAGANVTDLSTLKIFDPKKYLVPHSDIVALMVMEHQSRMHNLITRTNFETRIALRDSRVVNKMLKRNINFRSPSIKNRFDSSANRLVKYMLFTDEAKLTDPIKGTSGYEADFEKLAIKDRQGRSLRDFDLQTRMFKYPCSYLIYSEAFNVLPSEVKTVIYQKLWDILNSKTTDDDYKHLSKADRIAIKEILLATKKGLPSYWK
ncbi:hypothetical protein MNBD_PLANCTO02-260 [hydrothermal vent metagenome]|uniref:Cytochrome c domain-containing protein n=1 Tax=hydrothermal vent metagenome TaxID=652676 RepID=A0A3B1DQ50_9ZZZZ